MRKLLLLIFFSAAFYYQSSAQNSNSRDTSNKKTETEQDEVDKALMEREPTIEKGTWAAFLNKNINYDIAIFNDAPRGVYTVKVQFTVFEDGHVADVVALTKHGYGMEREVVKALKKSPNWKPAFQNGKNVKAIKIQTVKFVVETL